MLLDLVALYLYLYLYLYLSHIHSLLMSVENTKPVGIQMVDCVNQRDL